MSPKRCFPSDCGRVYLTFSWLDGTPKRKTPRILTRIQVQDLFVGLNKWMAIKWGKEINMNRKEMAIFVSSRFSIGNISDSLIFI
jgi:hypothetical protein